MNASRHSAFEIDATDGVSFVETAPGYWTVTVDGLDERTITKDGSGFIAWIGYQSRQWCFSKALKDCAENARYQRQLADEAKAAADAGRAALAAKSPAERQSILDDLEAERDALKWSPSHVDVAAKQAVIDRRIAAVREVA